MACLKLWLMGTFQAKLDEALLTGFESNKVRALLAYLALEAERAHSREMLATLLWPDWSQQAAMTNLRNALADLRRVIGDREAEVPHLLVTHDTLQLNAASEFVLDARAFQDLAGEAWKGQASPDSIARLEEAVGYYKGELLEGFSSGESAPFEEWVSMRREQLHRLMMQMLSRLVELYLACGEYAQAKKHAERQIELEPWLEEAHRQLMRSLALGDQRSAALNQYENCREQLMNELGVGPSEETIKLFEAIRDGRLDELKQAGVLLPAPGEPPFKGLLYFDASDAELFFGREALTSRLVEHMQEMGRSQRAVALSLQTEKPTDSISPILLTVVGASGSGKSSLVRAGLVPALKKENWTAQVITPTRHPLEILKGIGERGQGENYRFIIVDQFEEVFTLCREENEREAFIEQLLNIPDPLVIVLRADFYAACARYPRLRQALCARQEYIGAMSAAELRRAIEEPARRNGWELEQGLVELILRDVGARADHPPEPGALPLLSHALLETWKRRSGRLMTLKGYAEADGVHGAIAKTAETVYAGLDPALQAITRRIFLRLTEFGEGTLDTRRRASLAELVAHADQASQTGKLLEILAERRLITLSEGNAEVAHEALIREWPALREWLREDREGLRLQRRLTEAARNWQEMKRDPGELYRGARLAQALEWASQSGHAEELNELEQAFLQECQAEAQREIDEREAQRQRELESARKLAETERQRAEEQLMNSRRLRRRARTLVGVLAIALIFLFVAIGLGLAASNSQKVAQTESNHRATAIVQAQSEANQRGTAEAQAEAESNHRATAEVNALTEANNRATAEAVAEEQRDQALTNLQGLQAYQMAAESIRLSLEGKGSELSALLAVSSLNKQYTVQGEEALARAAQLPYPLRVFESGARDELRTAVLSQDGTKIAAVRISGNPLLWDVQTGQLLQDFHGFQGGSYTALTPDGGYIASVGDSGLAMVWETGSGKQVLCVGTLDKISQCQGVQTILPDTYKVSCIRGLGLSGDARYLLAGLNDGTVRTWEVSTGREALRMEGALSEPVITAVYSKDDRYVLSAASDNIVRLWDAQTSEQVQSFTGHIGEIHGLVLSQDGRYVASTSLDGTTRVWEVATGKELQRIEKQADNIDISPDGRNVVINELLWDWQTGKTFQYAMPHPCWGASFSWDGNAIARACTDGNVYLWAAKPTPLERLVPLPGASYPYLGITPDGKTLVVNIVNEVVLIDFASGKEIARLSAPEQIWNVGFSRDGQTIYGTGLGGSYFTWDTSSREMRSQFSLDIGGVGEVSPDGKQWILWDAGTQNDYWLDAMTGKTLCTFPGPYLQEAIFSPDGKRVALGGGDEGKNVVRIFSLPDCQNIQNLDASEGSLVVAEAFSPDGRYLAASLASEHNPVIIWDTQTGEIVHEIQTLPSYSWDLTYSPDGKYLAATSDNTYIWDTTSWNVVRRIVGSGMGVVFSPDGKWVVMTSLEQGWLKWSYFDLQELKDAVCRSLWRELSEAERTRFGITTTDPACP